MATSAFKSTTKRTPVGAPSKAEDSGSFGRIHRRSRSLSRFSRKLTEEFGEVPAARGRCVNKVRGSEFPEISLDDLANEFFSSEDMLDERDSERGRSSRCSSEISRSTSAAKSSQRRGRSVSRQSFGVRDGKTSISNGSGGGSGSSDANSRRRRSVSVVRCQISDSESEIDHSQNSSSHANMKNFNNGNSQMPMLQKPTGFTRQLLGRSLSQKDLSKLHNGYSRHSCALTDDEGRDSHSCKNMIEKTIRAVYAQKKVEHPIGDDVNSGLYEAMRKELRYAVDGIRMELEQAMTGKCSGLGSGECLQSDNSDIPQAVSVIRKNYTTKLEQSEKRKQDLLAEIVLEEQQGRELSKIVRELLPDPKSSANVEKPARARKSNDRNRMSKRLTEEANKYLEGFISNVEDTDISSFDEERSDGSSTLGGITKPRDAAATHYTETETFQCPATSNSLPVEMDGIILPWLQWETSNDGSLPCKNKKQPPVAPKTILWDAAQEVISTQEPGSHSTSSRGSSNPKLVDGPFMNTGEDTKIISKDLGRYQKSEFDMDRYLKLEKEEDLLFERLRQQNRINSGGLLLCSNHLF